MTETNQIEAMNDNRMEFETRRKQIAARAKTLAYKLERARFKTAWLTLGQVASLTKSPNV